MITLKKFFFEPNTIGENIIDPISFDRGLNIILGERSDESEKMNSVGKSLLVDMINYCLLSDSSLRISKIPLSILPKETLMCLEIEIELTEAINILTIKRTRETDKNVIISLNGVDKEFDKVEHAKKFIENFINNKKITNQPSFRNMISILIREEKSSYDDILRPYASKSYMDFSELIKPHLYLFGMDVSVIDNIKKTLKRITEAKTSLSGLNKVFKEQGINTQTIRSYLNNLEEKVNKLNISIQNLKPGEGIEQNKSTLQSLELELENYIVQKMAKKLLVRKIKNLPENDFVDSKKIEIIYNTYKQGLGSTIKKTLDEVQEFNNRVYTFQNQLFTQHLEKVQQEIADLDVKIQNKDAEISKIYASFNTGEKIEGLKKAIKEEREKHSELDRLVQKYNSLEEKKLERKTYEKNRDKLIDDLDQQIQNNKKSIRLFEEAIKDLHKIIAGNTNCQFDIVTSSQAEYVIFDYRIDLDGGSGMDRIRTFIYDILLMLSEVTSPRHYGFLIHDNIFPSTGRDDMVQSLNFVYKQSLFNKNFQYIVTLNKDEFEAQQKKFKFSSTEVTKASFTRSTPFLKTPYRET